MSEVKKLERDGMVAVLYSPDFGGGWVSWNNTEHAETLAFDAEIVQAVLDGDNDEAAVIAARKCPGIYTGGSRDLKVKWLPKGTQFEINEYDGNESIHVIGSKKYLVA